MLEHYIELVEKLCAANIAAEMQTLNMADYETGQQMHNLYQTLSTEGATSCLEAYVGYLSYSITSKSPPEVLQSYLNAAIGVPAAQRASLRDAVTHAYARMDSATTPHGPYYKTAGLYRIVLPATLHERLSMTPFSSHTDEAYSYRLYLTLIEDPRGPEGFQTALAHVSPNVEATSNLASGLSSLAVTLKRETRDATALLHVLSPLRDDQRRTTGVNGPGSGPAVQDLVRPVFTIFGQ